MEKTPREILTEDRERKDKEMRERLAKLLEARRKAAEKGPL